jgi:hypothetical protein
MSCGPNLNCFPISIKTSNKVKFDGKVF